MRWAVTGALCVILTSCGSSGSADRGAVASPSPTPDDRVVGLVAIGHSGLTGFASDPKRPDSSARENSWATGTNPAVDSIYRRLLKVEPQIEGHVANTAVNGSKADALLGEAQNAFAGVPHPQLVIIQTIDNDIRCDGTDEANHAVFAQSVRDALDAIVRQSPRTKILTLAQIGRPAGYFKAVMPNPSARQHFSGPDMCDGFDPAGRPVPARVATLTGIIEGYEKVLASVCTQYPQCSYSAVGMRYVDRLELLVQGDWDHLTIAGHAAVAALMWPEVARVLELPAS